MTVGTRWRSRGDARDLADDAGRPDAVGQIDLDQHALHAHNLSATDVAGAINAQNLMLPAGVARMGDREYNVRLNSSPELLAALEQDPVVIVPVDPSTPM